MDRRDFIKNTLLTGATLAVAIPAWSGKASLEQAETRQPEKPAPVPRTPGKELLEHSLAARNHPHRTGLFPTHHDPTYYRTSLICKGRGPLYLNT